MRYLSLDCLKVVYYRLVVEGQTCIRSCLLVLGRLTLIVLFFAWQVLITVTNLLCCIWCVHILRQRWLRRATSSRVNLGRYHSLYLLNDVLNLSQLCRIELLGQGLTTMLGLITLACGRGLHLIGGCIVAILHQVLNLLESEFGTLRRLLLMRLSRILEHLLILLQIGIIWLHVCIFTWYEIKCLNCYLIDYPSWKLM